MLSGAGKAQIKLDDVLPFDGFGAEHDPLFIRAVVFQNPDGRRACLLSVDATSMRDDTLLRKTAAESVDCEESDVWITVTHTFSAPHMRTPEHLANDEERARNELFSKRLVDTARKACSDARANLLPACYESARGTCFVNVNRDIETSEGWWLGLNPKGFSDHSLRTLRIVGGDTPRHTIATIFSVDVQASTMQGVRDDAGALLVSADFCGETARLLEDRLGGVALFLPGTAGDQAPKAKGQTALHELAQSMADDVEAALAAAKPLNVNEIELNSYTLICPAQRRADFHSLAPTRSYEFVEEGTIKTVLSLAKLGALRIVGVEPELNSVLGARLREAGKGRLEVLTMVNGAQKYLPSSVAYDLITYEAMNSSFARGADKLISSTILDLIKEFPA